MLACPPADRAGVCAVIGRVAHQRLVDDAARHGLSAVVADVLASAGALGLLERAAQERLQHDARASLARGVQHRRLLLRVVDGLVEAGVTPILLKGFALASRLYPEQPLGRPSTDVDVLVAPEALPVAQAALRRLGLEEVRPASLADVFEEHHHLSFVGPAALVELHFRLFTGFGRGAFDDAAVFLRSRPSSCEGRAVRLLAPEDEFLYLATHAANHSFLRVSWLVDLQRYLRVEPQLDWEVMAARARAAGFQTAVGAALWLLETALGVRLPSQARRAFPVRRWRRWGHARLFAPGQVEAAALAQHRVWGFALRVWLVDSPRAGLRHLLDGGRRLARQWKVNAEL